MSVAIDSENQSGCGNDCASPECGCELLGRLRVRCLPHSLCFVRHHVPAGEQTVASRRAVHNPDLHIASTCGADGHLAVWSIDHSQAIDVASRSPDVGGYRLSLDG